MGKKYTYEDVKHYIEVESGSNCILLSSEYKNVSEKVSIQCKCGDEFTTTFGKFKNRNKRQCNKCSNCMQWDYCSVKSYIEKDSESGCLLISDEYKDNKGKLKLRCKCGNEFTVNFVRFAHRNQRECSICSKKRVSRVKTQDIFNNEVRDMVEDEYSVIGDYTGAHTKLAILHNVCGYQWDVTPASFLHRKSRCPKCNGGIKKTQSEFISEVYDMYGDEYTVVGEYESYHHNRVKIKHNICDNTYMAIPAVLLKGIGCNICAESKGETSVREVLEKNDINYIKENTFDGLIGVGGNPLRFDFYLPDHNICIEYDGEFHFKKFYEDQNFETLQIHDKRKNQYCKDNNIPLIRIPYWQFDKIDQILDKWLSKYGLIHNEDIKGIA